MRSYPRRPLCEASEREIEDMVQATQMVMRRASEIVLSGFPLRSEAKVVRFPDRYMDKRGKDIWEKIIGLLQQQ